MRALRSYYLLITLLLASCFCYAQQNLMDSLGAALKNAKNDTTKLSLLLELSEECDPSEILKYAKPAAELSDKLLKEIPYTGRLRERIVTLKAASLNNVGFFYQNHGEISKALANYSESLKLYEGLGDKTGVANLLNNIGFIYRNQGKNQKALEYYMQFLKIKEENGDKKGLAMAFNNIGSIYYLHGDIPTALDYYSRGLKIREEVNDKKGIAYSLNNIAAIYENQDEAPRALDYYMRGLKILETLGDKQGYAIGLNNVGGMYRFLGDTSKAFEYFSRSLKIREEIGDKQGIALALNNLGTIYELKCDFSKGLVTYNRSLLLRKGVEDKEGITWSFFNIANIYFKQKKYQPALSYSDSSLSFSIKFGYPEIRRNAEQLLSKIYSEKRNYPQAFEHYKQFIIYRDSIGNEKTRKASIKSQLKYEYEKKEAVLKEKQDKEHVLAEEKSLFQQIIIWSVVGGLVLVMLFAAFVFRTLKTTRKQKVIIEEKQREILDSIHYAKRIQTALITNENYIHKNLTRLQNS